MSADPFLKVQRDIEDAKVPKRAHPKGWEPGLDSEKGVVTHLSGSPTPPSSWDGIIRELGLDPSEFTVDPSQSVQVRTWDTPGADGGRMYYYKASVIPASSASALDVDDLIREVKRRKPKPPKDILAERALVACLADWQAGKADSGGVEALIERLLALKDAVPARIREAQKVGKPISHLYVVTMGDLIENCSGHYPMQSFSVELDRRQQVKLVRRMLTMMLMEWSRLPVKIVVGAVPGNHGENRNASAKAYTSFEDNDDLAAVEQVQEILGANKDAFGDISWVIPDGDMTITLDICGQVVGFLHGHQARRGSTPQAKLQNWWRGKMASQHPIGDAQILVSAHYHHLTVVVDGPRTWMQCPANDGGSRWFVEQGGATTACGTLTFVVDRSGWSDLAIL